MVWIGPCQGPSRRETCTLSDAGDSGARWVQSCRLVCRHIPSHGPSSEQKHSVEKGGCSVLGWGIPATLLNSSGQRPSESQPRVASCGDHSLRWWQRQGAMSSWVLWPEAHGKSRGWDLDRDSWSTWGAVLRPVPTYCCFLSGSPGVWTCIWFVHSSWCVCYASLLWIF